MNTELLEKFQKIYKIFERENENNMISRYSLFVIKKKKKIREGTLIHNYTRIFQTTTKTVFITIIFHLIQ